MDSWQDICFDKIYISIGNCYSTWSLKNMECIRHNFLSKLFWLVNSFFVSVKLNLATTTPIMIKGKNSQHVHTWLIIFNMKHILLKCNAWTGIVKSFENLHVTWYELFNLNDYCIIVMFWHDFQCRLEINKSVYIGSFIVRWYLYSLKLDWTSRFKLI